MGNRLDRAHSPFDEDAGVSARQILDAAPDALVVVDAAGVIVRFNAATARLFGYSREELLGRPIETLIAARDRDACLHHLASCRDEPPPPGGLRADLCGVRSDGAEFPMEVDLAPLATARGRLIVSAIRDVSAHGRPPEDERKSLVRERALHAHLSHVARHDALTGLPNRALLHDRLAGAIQAAARGGLRPAVLFLDLDRFKQVNDSLGHAIGDWLLESVALRLTASVRSADTVSRQGGDEFVILLPDARSRDEVAGAAAKIIDAVSGLHRVAGHDLHVTASMGIAAFPEAGQDSETLIKNADIAMYHAKEEARGRFRFFAEEMTVRVVERQALEGGLRGALERQEFVLHYQPKIDLSNGLMIGAEALLRWNHPERGLLAPERFVPLAEDSGLIVPIGQWVFREACRQAQEWQATGLQPVPVAVNVSAIEVRNGAFVNEVRRILDETRFDPRLLEIELTESVLMDNAAATRDVLDELKAIGLGLALDDFGTGYSSLSYLARFPIDALKVDQSFVREITSAREGSPIIAAVISMGKSLKHRVIAEGVETAEQVAFLRAQQCEEGQGFHFSRPLAADRFAALLPP